jgi:hypothetical protein
MLTVLTSLGIRCPVSTINITSAHNGKQQAALFTIWVLIKSNLKPANMQ